MVHLHNGILVGCNKEENFTLCDSMGGPGEHYAKSHKPVKERQIPNGQTHMWNLMNKTELTSKIETDSWVESRLTALGVGQMQGLEGQSKKQTQKELMDEDGSVVIAEVGGGGGRGYKGDKL